MSGQVIATLDTGTLAFHDAQLDYYGKRAAAACGAPAQPDDSKGLPEGDYTIYIWDITDGQQKLTGQLKGHEGPVWKVSWAHPKFGSLLASCGYDMKVIIWKEVGNQWQKAFVDSSHAASVNDVEFCPWEHGCRVACASSDGTVSVLTYIPTEARWARSVFQAHPCGAQSVSWAPPMMQRDHTPAVRLATGGCDNSVCIWKCDGEIWSQESPALLPAHTDWVRKVAWRPDGTSTVASGSWDKTVVVWKQEMEGQPWRQVAKITVAGRVEGLAWSVTGSLLGVSFDDGETILYKETDDGRYEEVGKCGEQGYTETAKPPGGSPPAAFNVGGGPPPAAAAFGVPQEQVQANAELAAQQQSVLESFGMM